MIDLKRLDINFPQYHFLILLIVSLFFFTQCSSEGKTLINSNKVNYTYKYKSSSSLIDINFPVLVNNDSKSKFNYKVKTIISKWEKSFKDDIEKNYNSSNPSNGQLNIDYIIFNNDKGLISIVLEIKVDYGAIKPFQIIKTINYNFKTDTFLSLNELIKSEKGYNELITRLNNKLEINWESNECSINKEIKHLENFNFNSDSLILGLANRELDRHCEIQYISFSKNEVEDIIDFSHIE